MMLYGAAVTKLVNGAGAARPRAAARDVTTTGIREITFQRLALG